MQQLFRAIRYWNPEFIGIACPFIVCTLIGPGCYNIHVCHKLGALNQDGNSRGGKVWLEMYKLVLRRVGAYWPIGSHALGILIRRFPNAFQQLISRLELVEALEAEKWSPTMMDQKQEYSTLARDFRVLVPTQLRTRP